MVSLTRLSAKNIIRKIDRFNIYRYLIIISALSKLVTDSILWRIFVIISAYYAEIITKGMTSAQIRIEIENDEQFTLLLNAMVSRMNNQQREFLVSMMHVISEKLK